MKKIEVKVRYLFEGTYIVAADDRNEARTYFIEQDRLYASMQGVDPTLVFGFRFPNAYHIVAVFVKFHFYAGFIVGCATKTIVPFFV